ncbi:MAG: hypothetical protein HQM03_02170 [Magnetococcales bacterium]|nr:hypothetical protein [Magnetococcales bacterium]
MNIWNLMVVVCFGTLYLALTLVFLQIQKLREELKLSRAEPEVESLDPTEYMSMIRREIAAFEERFESAISAIPEQLRKDLQGIQADLRFLSRPMAGGTMGKMSDVMVGGGGSNMSDAYREARLLLANGVDEERVINETGLAVEEVSLLKRLGRNPDDFS